MMVSNCCISLLSLNFCMRKTISEKENILIAAIGMSPAVLTETIWALAQENPPWIPDQVIAITTLAGRTKIKEMLLSSKGWKALHDALKKQGCPVDDALRFGADDTIRVIGDGGQDFKDIATLEQNREAADFILRVIREHTENPKTEIVASIAGGRKTMSALMLSCMSLLGREQDRVCHILANDDFIFANQGFLFPKNKTEEKKAKIVLSDIPFIRVRGLYEQKSGEVPSSYSDMVHIFHKAAPPAINYPKIKVQKIEGKIFADGEDLELSPKEFLLCMVLIETFLKHGKLFSSWEEVSAEIIEAMKLEDSFGTYWHEKILDINYRKARWSAVASEIRKKRLKGRPYADVLLPGPGTTPRFPSDHLTIEP